MRYRVGKKFLPLSRVLALSLLMMLNLLHVLLVTRASWRTTHATTLQATKTATTQPQRSSTHGSGVFW